MRQLWGALWRSESALDGVREHLINEDCTPVLFRVRREAREWIKEKYGYIRHRPDLRAEPHGWKMPRAVKVLVMTDKECREMLGYERQQWSDGYERAEEVPS